MILVSACKEEKSHDMLQQNQIQLVQPRIMVSNRIIDSTVTLAADFMMADVKIVFTKDGTEPKEKSTSYTKPIIVSEPETFKFKAFHNEWKPSEIAEISLVKKGHDVDSVIWINNINQKYLGQGSRTLINHTKATNNFMNPQWMGFEETVSMVCLFEDKEYITSIDIGYLYNPGSWIFPPKEIAVSMSLNGIDFVEISRHMLNEPVQSEDVVVETFAIPLNKEIKFLRLDIDNMTAIPEWHEGKGNKAWLFMDEIIFNK